MLAPGIGWSPFRLLACYGEPVVLLGGQADKPIPPEMRSTCTMFRPRWRTKSGSGCIPTAVVIDLCWSPCAKARPTHENTRERHELPALVIEPPSRCWSWWAGSGRRRHIQLTVRGSSSHALLQMVKRVRLQPLFQGLLASVPGDQRCKQIAAERLFHYAQQPYPAGIRHGGKGRQQRAVMRARQND